MQIFVGASGWATGVGMGPAQRSTEEPWGSWARGPVLIPTLV